MNWVDVVIIVVMGISVLFGVRWGLIKEVFILLALIFGVIIAGRSYSLGAKILSSVIHSPNAANILGFVLMFILVAVILTIIGVLLKRLIRLIRLGWIDRAGGGVFGLLRWAIIIGVAVAFITRFPVLGSDKWMKDAILPPFFLHFIESLWRLIPPELSRVVYV